MEENKKKRVRRTRTDLERDIMDTVAKLIHEKGFTHITFMDVANASKTDINVLRRNFGSLDNLLDRYAHTIDYWLSRLLDQDLEVAECREAMGEKWVTNVYGKLIHFLYENEDMQRLLVWQTVVDNPTTRRISRNRDLYYKNIQEQFYKNFENEDVPIAAIMALLISGIYYLVLTRKRSTFCGVDFNKKEGMKEMERACSFIMDLLFNLQKQNEHTVQIASKMKEKGLTNELISECTGLSLERVENL